MKDELIRKIAKSHHVSLDEEDNGEELADRPLSGGLASMGRRRRLPICALVIVAFVLMLVPLNNFEKVPLRSMSGMSFERARVVQVVQDNVAEDGNRYGDQQVVVEVTSGEHAGAEYRATSPSGNLFGAPCKVGMHVIVMLSVAGDNANLTVYSQDRILAIVGLVLAFVLAVCLIGGRKGVMAVLSLVFAFVCMLWLMFPAIYRGASPVLMAVVVSVLTTVVTLGLLDGISRKSIAAMVGTSLGVFAAGAVALVFGAVAGISGYNVSDIETLNSIALVTDVQVGQLLFAGIIISALGAVMDVGMSVASTVHELLRVNPELTRKELYSSALHVGRDMMGTMTNTLIFAFVGGSITALLVDYAYDIGFLQLINSYNIGIEVMQGFAGSIGVVLTVPITAAIAVWLEKRS